MVPITFSSVITLPVIRAAGFVPILSRLTAACDIDGAPVLECQADRLADQNAGERLIHDKDAVRAGLNGSDIAFPRGEVVVAGLADNAWIDGDLPPRNRQREIGALR
jgi:hypothetical protein